MGLLESIFFRTASDKKLSKKRETIREKRNSSYDEKKYDKYFWKLNRYDNEMTRRANKKYKKENPNAKTRHREHGWYLPNDD